MKSDTFKNVLEFKEELWNHQPFLCDIIDKNLELVSNMDGDYVAK